mgnify:FL=1|jgi:hypothetical protein|tara:strand:+ start:500 stop:805 length:306 start_codon:yes stop_codon:yes gene_type:complete
MTVYVVQKPDKKKNIMSAKEYGELRFILNESENILYNPEQVISLIEDSLSLFDEKDYLLLIGDPIAIGIATHFALLSNYKRVKILKWDNREYKYYSIQLEV